MKRQAVLWSKSFMFLAFTLITAGCSNAPQEVNPPYVGVGKADFWGVNNLCERACNNQSICDGFDQAAMTQCLTRCRDLSDDKAACLALRDMSDGWTCDEEIEYCLKWYEPSQACVDACKAWDTCKPLEGDQMPLCIADCETWRSGAAECLPQRDMSDGRTCDEEIEYCLRWYEPAPAPEPTSLCLAACDNQNLCDPLDKAEMAQCLTRCRNLSDDKVACLALRDMSDGWTCDEEIEYCLKWYTPSQTCVDACAAWNTCEPLEGDRMPLCIADCETWRSGAAECLPQRDMSDGRTCDEEIEYCLKWYEPSDG
ncbi:MAG: hypothetical protein JRH20_25255 [Deltaproteobacteria bacterium]|nr:hypothetical protein [Deltaproteobacteria bacterium]